MNKAFEDLLKTVRKNNPELISEQVEAQMMADYNGYEDQLKQDSYDQGHAAGFTEGYNEGIEKQKMLCQQEMDELVAKLDEEALTKLENIIRVLNEDHATKLQEIYDLCCQTMVPMADVENMDAEHAEKLQQFAEAIDKAHAEKMQLVYESVKKKATDEVNAKTKEITDKFTNMLNESTEKLNAATKALEEEKEKKMSMLVESVDKYFNYALQKAIPTKKIVSEAKFNASQKTLDKITSLLKLNAVIQESKDGIFQDYEDKIAAAKEEQNKLMVENVNLKNTLQKKEAKLLLESKIAKCTPAEAAFLRTYFETAKSPKIIEEQIDDARNAYNRLHSEKRAEKVEKAKSSAAPSGIVTENKKPEVTKEEPKKKVVTENAETNPNLMDMYAAMLKKH